MVSAVAFFALIAHRPDPGRHPAMIVSFPQSCRCQDIPDFVSASTAMAGLFPPG